MRAQQGRGAFVLCPSFYVKLILSRNRMKEHAFCSICCLILSCARTVYSSDVLMKNLMKSLSSRDCDSKWIDIMHRFLFHFKYDARKRQIDYRFTKTAQLSLH
jgi:hypothetical protein